MLRIATGGVVLSGLLRYVVRVNVLWRGSAATESQNIANYQQVIINVNFADGSSCISHGFGH